MDLWAQGAAQKRLAVGQAGPIGWVPPPGRAVSRRLGGRRNFRVGGVQASRAEADRHSREG
eukprot:5987678-Amphidinium_carterae.1